MILRLRFSWNLTANLKIELIVTGKNEKIEKVEAKEREAEELRRKLQAEEEAAKNPVPEPEVAPTVTQPDASEVTSDASGNILSIFHTSFKLIKHTDEMLGGHVFSSARI